MRYIRGVSGPTRTGGLDLRRKILLVTRGVEALARGDLSAPLAPRSDRDAGPECRTCLVR